MPLGIFITFGLLVVVTLSLRHAKLEQIFKRILFFYCLSATRVSFFCLLIIFERFDILYGLSAMLAIVLFHHMLCFMIRFDKPFYKKHYITAAIVCAILLVCKFVVPSFWAKEAIRTLIFDDIRSGRIIA